MIVHKIDGTGKASGITSSVSIKKVAAYCRVSTDEDEQVNSYEVQIDYYTKKITETAGWVMAGIFADKGITGTLAKKRPEFIKMIKLCRKHRIDLVLAKSISRFARNTVDCLEYIRELKSLGIGVIFEKENINTLTETSEALITIMGYFAQAESESISKNVTWGMRQSMETGKGMVFANAIYGYRKDESGAPVIVPSEAENIRLIYDLYLTGESLSSIQRTLAERGIQAPGGNSTWSSTTLMNLLKNEKYKGDVLTQKSYCPDFMSHKRIKNNGQVSQHYYTDHHPGIVDRSIFDRVQAEFARRSSKKKALSISHDAPERGKYSSKYALTELLVCGQCGAPYRRCTWNIRGNRKIVWRCVSRLTYGKDACPDSCTLDESDLQAAIMNGLSKLSSGDSELRNQLKCALAELLESNGTDMSIPSLELQMKEQEKQLMKLIRLTAEDANIRGKSEAELKRISDSIKDLQQLIEVEKSKVMPEHSADSRINQIFNMIDSIDITAGFDDKLIRQLIAQVQVIGKNKLTVILKSGFRFDADL